MPTDTMQKLGNTLVQHGPDNDRIYVIHLDPADCPGIVDDLLTLACEEGYSKIVGKVPQHFAECFARGGFVVEARIPGYCQDGSDALYMGRFLTESRTLEKEPSLVADVISAARLREKSAPTPAKGYELAVMQESDAPEMAKVYSSVFKTYPFAIDDPEFIVSTMENVRYYAMKKDGEIAALASSDMDREAGSVEMTDFATMPEHQGRGLAFNLLERMDLDMADMGLRTAFTIARSRSHAMNITFAKAGYEFRGTLLNNTHIHGDLESMNIWSREL